MGGVGAWKDKEKEQKELRQKWDREELEAERERMRSEEGDERQDEYSAYDSANDAVTAWDGEGQDEDISGLDDVSLGSMAT